MKRLSFLLLMLIALAMHSNFSLIASTKYLNSKGEYKIEAIPVPDEMKSVMDNMFQAVGGEEFYVLFPPNDTNAGLGNMSIYVGATKANTTVYIKGTNGVDTKGIINEAYTGLVFSTTSDGLNSIQIVEKSWEVRGVDELPENRGFCISTDPGYEIFVYVGSFRSATADGYMALPTTGLGKTYIHCSNYDNDEGGTHTHFRTGFTAIAAYNNTVLNAKIRFNNGFCITETGKTNGALITSRPLEAGQVWNIQNGLEPNHQGGTCDLSGTIITGNNNFGVVSWVQRTAFPPNSVERNRDNLCEQLLPVNKWGTLHYSVQFRGNFEAYSNVVNNPNPGQIFRVVASEADTKSEAAWYNHQTGEAGDNWTVTLKNQGDWEEYIKPPGNPKEWFPSIWGACVWKANKPVQILQYQTTQGYVYGGNTDPCMVLLVPVEQYGNNTIFQTASSGNSVTFNEHFVTLIAEGDSTNYSEAERILGSIKIHAGGANNEPKRVTEMDGGVAFYSDKSRFAGSNYSFARLKLEENQIYRIAGETSLSGVIYGWGSVISYGWPTSMKLVVIDTNDKLSPETEFEFICDRQDRETIKGLKLFRGTFADNTDIDYGPWESPQIDIGLVKAPDLLYDETNNLEIYKYTFLEYVPESATPPSPGKTWNTNGLNIRKGIVEYSLIDMYEDVYAAIKYEDEVGNSTTDTIIHIADKIKWYDLNGVEKLYIGFGSQIVGNEYLDTIIIKNIDDVEHTIDIDSIFLRGGGEDAFSIVKGSDINVLGPLQEDTIVVRYFPQNAADVKDILTIYTDCQMFRIDVTGGAGMPMIRVSDFHFGEQLINVQSSGNYIKITNPGTKALEITKMYFVPNKELNALPFIFKATGTTADTPSVANPWIVPPYNDSLVVRYFYFMPDMIGPHEIEICFASNAAPLNLDPGRKECGLLQGFGINPGPSITSVNFYDRRVLTINDTTIKLINEGNTPITISDIVNVADGWRVRTVDGKRRLESPETDGANYGSYYIPDIDEYIGQVIYPEVIEGEPKEINIKVVFEPQSEVQPYGYSPDAVKFHINFQEAGVVDNETTSYLSGRGILPKIEATGYTYTTPTKVDEICPDAGFIQIHNPSETSLLKIKEIKFDSGHTTDFIPDRSFDSYENTVIEIGGSLDIPVTFAPKSTDDPMRIAWVKIVSDAEVGPNVDPTVDTLVKLEGIAYDEGIDFDSIDYGRVTRCEEPMGELIIENLSTTTVLTIDDVLVEDDYKEIFEIISPEMPFDIEPSKHKNVTVRFKPSNYYIGSNPGVGGIEAEVTIKTKMGEYLTVFKATPLIVPVNVSLHEHLNQLPGTTIDFPIDIEIPSSPETFYNFANANITEFEIVLKASLKALNFEGVDGPSNGTWTYSIVNQDINEGLVTIKGEGNVPINAAGRLCTPRVKILLSDLTTIPVEIESISFGSRDNCIASTFVNGSIKYTICAEDIRVPNISNSDFGVKQISPNPFTDDILEVNYSVGFDVDTKLLIYNSNGELVRTLVDEIKSSGEHTAKTNVSNLGSGAYIIKMKSGPFETQQNLVIVR